MNTLASPLSAEQTHAMLQWAPGAAFLLADFMVLKANDQAHKWLDCQSDEELHGKSLMQWSKPIQAQKKTVTAEALFARMMAEAKDKGVLHCEWHFQRSDGADLYAQLCLRSIRTEAEGFCLYCTASDVSELRQHSQKLSNHLDRFKKMFDSSLDAIWLLRGNVFVGCNQAAVKLMGCSDRRDLLNKHPSELSPPVQPDGEPSYEKANRMGRIAYKQNGHRFEWVHRRANGEDFYAEVALVPMEIDIGEVMLCSTHDISERKKLEDKLKTAIAVLQSEVAALKAKA
jgi:PAS domain S-box-containing protein